MCFFKRKNARLLATEAAGLRWSNPVGLYLPADTPPAFCKKARTGFLTLPLPKADVLAWIGQLSQRRGEHTLLAVNLSHDIPRHFSLTYDFADLLIIDPDPSGGIGSPDVSDILSLMDNLLSLRLCYERFTPVFIRLPQGIGQEEIQPLLHYCQMSSVDGVVAPGLRMVKQVAEATLGRLPIMGSTTSAQEAGEMLRAGASLVELNTRPLAALKFIKELENNKISQK